jgi:pimeloyl-ACP methyl ester carboxylesterase
MQVELVSCIASDGVRLEGALRHGEPRTLAVDAALCLHGAHSNFYAPLFFDSCGESMLPAGVAILRVNTRGHDDVFMQGPRRLGGGFEIVDDCKLDIAAWLDFLESRGYTNILLWGHSLGAVKTAYYMAGEPDARIVCAVASSPPRFNYAMEMARPDPSPFAGPMQRAQALVAEGKPDETVEAKVPIACLFAAGAYVDKYGPADRYDYIRHLPSISKPFLITVGGEEQTYYYDEIRARGPALDQELPSISYQLIEGANHVYNTRVGELWQCVHDWLQSRVPLHAASSV